jgi:hypothetical protein
VTRLGSGLGAWSGSRDQDAVSLARKAWNLYGNETIVVGLVYEAWEDL